MSHQTEIPQPLIGFFFVQLLVILLALRSCYRRCRESEALIVHMDATTSKVLLQGQATFVLPVIQSLEILSLAPKFVNVSTTSPLITADGVSVDAEILSEIRVETDPVSVISAHNFFHGTTEAEATLRQIVFDACSTHIASLNFDEIPTYLDLGAPDLIAQLQNPLKKLGMNCKLLKVEKISRLMATSSN